MPADDDSPDDAVTVEFTLSAEEYRAASQALMSRTWVIYLFPVIGVLLLVAAFLASVTYLFPALVMFACVAWLWWGAPRQRWRRDPAQAGPFSYRFDDNGVGIKSSAGTMQLPWGRVTKVIETDHTLLLKIGRSAVLVPYRAMADGDREELRALLAERVRH